MGLILKALPLETEEDETNRLMKSRVEESWKNGLLSNHQNCFTGQIVSRVTQSEIYAWVRLEVWKWMENILLLFIVALMENGEEKKVRDF